MGKNDDLLVDVVLDIVRVSNLLDRLGGQYAKKSGLSSLKQYKVLAMLFLEEGLSMGDLQQNTLVTKQAITGLVDRLSQAEYLETYKDSNDRRITRVTLTTKGRDVLQEARPMRILGNREAFSVLSEEEIAQLSSILDKLVHHLRP